MKRCDIRQTLIICGVLFFLFWQGNVHAWYQCEWSHRTELSFTNATGQAVSQYPVLLEVDASFFPVTYNWLGLGNDIRFVASDGVTELSHFTEYWDATNKVARIWVVLNTLAANSSATFYVYHGNQNAADSADITPMLVQPGIRVHSRNSTLDPTSFIQARDAFQSLTDSVAGYGCAVSNQLTGVNNRSLFDPDRNSNFLLETEVFFYVSPADAGVWDFRFGGDYGHGGGLYVDGVVLEERWDTDLWWAFNWANADVISGSINLTAGYHRLSTLGGEGCCDGSMGLEFRKPGGSYQEFNTTNLTIGSRQCPVGPEVSWIQSAVTPNTATPAPLISHTTQNLTDPINLTVNPKRIPMATVRTFISLQNSGTFTDSDSLVLTEKVADDMSVLLGGSQMGTSIPYGNLSLIYNGAADIGDDVAFSNNNGGDFNYQPVPGAEGEDSSITHIRYSIAGDFGCMQPADAFQIYYDALIR